MQEFIPQGRDAIEKKLDYLISVQEQVLFLHGSGNVTTGNTEEVVSQKPSNKLLIFF